jgi:hypothetical protein
MAFSQRQTHDDRWLRLATPLSTERSAWESSAWSGTRRRTTRVLGVSNGVEFHGESRTDADCKREVSSIGRGNNLLSAPEANALNIVTPQGGHRHRRTAELSASRVLRVWSDRNRAGIEAPALPVTGSTIPLM